MKVKTIIVKPAVKAKVIPGKKAVTRMVFELNMNEARFIRSILGPMNNNEIMDVLQRSRHYDRKLFTENKVVEMHTGLYQGIGRALQDICY